MKTVSDYINESLNPSKHNFYDGQREDYIEPKSIEEILNMLDINVDAYYRSLEISDDNEFQIHLRRTPNSCFVNNYFRVGLEAWKANMDIQPVFNEKKAVPYMCAYLSKSEDTCSNAMKQALKVSIENKCSNYEQMTAIACAYSSNRECSEQEVVYHCLPELWLRKVFPGVIYANTNIPEKRFRVLRSQKEIGDLLDDSNNIFKRNMLDRYVDRPDESFCNGRYGVLSKSCYAEFLRSYYIVPSANENDWQPMELKDELLEVNSPATRYPIVISLMSSKEKIKCRKLLSVLRYFTPNKNRDYESYAHHLLLLFEMNQI